METPIIEQKVYQVEQRTKVIISSINEQGSTNVLNSSDLLNRIYKTINSPSNHQDQKPYKLSIILEETQSAVATKCNCKKSKCLKLYCECFAQGSFCNGCNCDCCQNTVQFSENRAKAIDEVLNRTSISFGHKNSSIKGCNCKKTNCQKKYCECFSSGGKCSEYCKCQSCENL